jgi:Spy/CpxP family protein refolding chaperone
MKYLIAVVFAVTCVHGFAQEETTSNFDVTDAAAAMSVMTGDVNASVDEAMVADSDESGVVDGKGHHHHHHGHHHHLKACRKIGLDADQKAALKALLKETHEATHGLVTAVKTARKAYHAVLADPKSDDTAAKAAAKTLNDAKAAKADAKRAFEVKAFYTILKPEQRAQGVLCLEAIRKHRRHHHHGHHGHHHHHQHGGGQN